MCMGVKIHYNRAIFNTLLKFEWNSTFTIINYLGCIHGNCQIPAILDLHVGYVADEAQKNILSILLWAPVVVDEQHCLVIPERLVASQE